MGKSAKGTLITINAQLFSCPYCDYTAKKEGECNLSWSAMIERLHKKRCKQEGRTEPASAYEKQRKQHLNKIGFKNIFKDTSGAVE